MIPMTSEQHRAIEEADGRPVRVLDPRTGTAYDLVRADLFREMSELIEDETQRHAIAERAGRNAAAQMDDEAPEMLRR